MLVGHGLTAGQLKQQQQRCCYHPLSRAKGGQVNDTHVGFMLGCFPHSLQLNSGLHILEDPSLIDNTQKLKPKECSFKWTISQSYLEMQDSRIMLIKCGHLPQQHSASSPFRGLQTKIQITTWCSKHKSRRKHPPYISSSLTASYCIQVKGTIYKLQKSKPNGFVVSRMFLNEPLTRILRKDSLCSVNG